MVALSFRYESGTDLRVFSTLERAYRYAVRLMEEHSDYELVNTSTATLEDQIAMLDEWNEFASSDYMEIVIQEATVDFNEFAGGLEE